MGGVFRTMCLIACALASQQGHAADRVAARPSLAPAWSWNGLYVGGHLGGAWGVKNWSSDPTGYFSGLGAFPNYGTAGGSIGGGQVGFNYQSGSIVLGLEADASWASVDGTTRCAFAYFICSSRVNSLGTLAARIGVTLDRTLLYAKAGAAWAHDKYHMNSFEFIDVLDGSQTRWGWMGGGGLEYAFAPDWSAKVEYDYLDLGTARVVFMDTVDPTPVPIDIRQNLHLIKLGINYRFAGAQNSWTDAPTSSVALTLKAPPIAWNWSGIYVGGHGGGGWGTTAWSDPTGFFGGPAFAALGDVDGFVAGGQVGANYQMGRMVLGLEADASWADLDGNAVCIIGIFRCHARIDLIRTLTGRVGVTFGQSLLYLKGGGALVSEKYDIVSCCSSFVFTGDQIRSGWTAGAGIEYAFTPSWSGKVEYDYVDLGNRTATVRAPFNISSPVNIEQNLHLVEIGVNYKFGQGFSSVGPSAAAPARMPTKAPPLQFSDWQIEAGSRYWFSSGSMTKNLFSPVRVGSLNSRITYGQMQGHSLEAFGRLDHRSGIFLKGNFGLGDLVNGNLNDEDFPPAVVPYSNTLSQMRDGRLRNASLDLGYSFFAWQSGKVGAFAGYRYFYERINGFGCTQLASNPACAPGGFPPTYLILSEAETWRAAAVGLNAQVTWNRLKLDVDAAWLPYVNFAGVDNHWNRPDINPGVENGWGHGVQLEAFLSYLVTQRWSVGVGARYWAMKANGEWHFAGAQTSPMDFQTNRSGGILQTSYKFGP
jgi:opacity protein-like surface antigen